MELLPEPLRACDRHAGACFEHRDGYGRISAPRRVSPRKALRGYQNGSFT